MTFILIGETWVKGTWEPSVVLQLLVSFQLLQNKKLKEKEDIKRRRHIQDPK